MFKWGFHLYGRRPLQKPLQRTRRSLGVGMVERCKDGQEMSGQDSRTTPKEKAGTVRVTLLVCGNSGR